MTKRRELQRTVADRAPKESRLAGTVLCPDLHPRLSAFAELWAGWERDTRVALLPGGKLVFVAEEKYNCLSFDRSWEERCTLSFWVLF